MKNKSLKKAGETPAFTMVELVFVIVVLGILAAVAIPRLAASRDDAVLVKAKSQISAIRSGIAMQKSRRLLQGTTPVFLPSLDTGGNNVDNARLFNFSDGNTSNILEYPIFSRQNRDGDWFRSANDANTTTYRLQLQTGNIARFVYDNRNGTFNCFDSPDCTTLTQ